MASKSYNFSNSATLVHNGDKGSTASADKNTIFNGHKTVEQKTGIDKWLMGSVIVPKNSERQQFEAKQSDFNNFDAQINNLISTSNSSIYTLLMDAWLKHTLTNLKSFNGDWLAKTVIKTQNYIVATYNFKESRLFMSTFLGIAITNSTYLEDNANIRNEFIKLLERYQKSSRTTKDRVNFLKSARSLHLSTSGL